MVTAAPRRARSFDIAGAPQRVSAEDPATLARPDAGTDAGTDARPDARPTHIPAQVLPMAQGRISQADPRERKRAIRDVQSAAYALRAAVDRVADKRADLLTELDRATAVLGSDEVTGILALAGVDRGMITS